MAVIEIHNRKNSINYYIEHQKKLPDLCYMKLEENDDCVVIKKGIGGYHSTDIGKVTDEQVSKMNADLGITGAQKEAMVICSMFRW